MFRRTLRREAFIAIEAQLTPQEEYIYRRGRNTKPTTVPKNAGVKDYRSATGLETLVGYLFLTGQLERLMSLWKGYLPARGRMTANARARPKQSQSRAAADGNTRINTEGKPPQNGRHGDQMA